MKSARGGGYRQKFNQEAASDFPELQQLVNAGLATVTSMMKEYEVR